MRNTFFKIVKSVNKNRFKNTFLIFLLLTCSLFAQEKNYVKYTVLKGETITQIAIKYKVTPYDIYKLNPDSQSGIKESDVILIPIVTQKENKIVAGVSSKTNVTKNTAKNHVVKPKETFYSISRDYNVNVETLKSSNAEIFNQGLKVGQTIRIPSQQEVAEIKPEVVKMNTPTPRNTETNKQEVKLDQNVYHIVEPKETKFGISKKYGISVQELEKNNPSIISNLPIGYKLLISGSVSNNEGVKQELSKPRPVIKEVVNEEITNSEPVKTVKKESYSNYEVKPKETLYSLSQKFSLSQEALIDLNPALKSGVKIGMILKVPGQRAISVMDPSSHKFTDLSKSINNQTRKKLVFLIPFNANKIQADTLKSLSVKLKKDVFLNMTLDYYSGVLMAIDSAKALGLNLDIKIFDSEENKYSSNVANLIKDNDLKNADAVVGPFYQQHVDKVAELLKESNVPVISPLSKEVVKLYPNLYQAMPTNGILKSAMMEFLISNNGNILVVIDPKRISNKEFISKNYPTAQFVDLNENGSLNAVNLKALFVKDKMNYVILDTEKTALILETTNVLLNEYSNYQLQLAIIEANETLDFDEISLKRLTVLKMLYPSINRENSFPEATIFRNEYKKKNKVFPNQFAVRGFDIAFDTMLRLSQSESFKASVEAYSTQQIENKFEYVKKDAAGNINKGVYILEFEEDLSIKQLN